MKSIRSRRFYLIVRNLLAIFSVAALVLCIFWMVLSQWIEMRIHEGMDEAERQRFDDWMTKPVSFPPEAFETGISEKTLRSGREILSLIDESREDFSAIEALGNGVSVYDPDTWDFNESEARELLSHVRNVSVTFTSLVSRPDYTMDLWYLIAENRFSGHLSPLSQMRDLLSFQWVLELKEGNCQKAIDIADVFVRSSRIHHYPSVLHIFLSVTLQGEAIAICEHAIGMEEDTQRLLEYREHILRFEESFPVLADYEDWEIFHTAAIARLKMSTGEDVDISPKPMPQWDRALFYQSGYSGFTNAVLGLTGWKDKAFAVEAFHQNTALIKNWEEKKKDLIKSMKNIIHCWKRLTPN